MPAKQNSIPFNSPTNVDAKKKVDFAAEAQKAVNTQRSAVQPAKEEFHPSRYDKHSMQVAPNWVAPSVDFSKHTTREERQKAQKQYLSHTSDLTYFLDGASSDVFAAEDPRRRRAKPIYRVKGVSFNHYTTREERARVDRSTTALERAQISSKPRSPLRAKARPSAASDPSAQDAASASATTTADVKPASTKEGSNNEQPQSAAEKAYHEMQEKLARPQSAPHVRGTPSFERSVHTSVSRLQRAAQDEALLWGTGAMSTTAFLNTLSQREEWKPFSLGAYDVPAPGNDDPKAVPLFATMAGHDGYRAKRTQARRPQSAGATRADGSSHDVSAHPTSTQQSSGMQRVQVAVEEGKRHAPIDRNTARSVPDFSKALGKEAHIISFKAIKGCRDVDFGLHVNYDFNQRHLRKIDISKSAMRPAPRQVAYSTHMHLFPKYEVVDKVSPSPRIGPKKHPGPRPSSAPSQRSGDGSRPQSAGQRPNRQDAVSPASLRKTDSSDTLGAALFDAQPGKIRPKSASSQRPGAASGPLGEPLGPQRNDDLCHPRITRNIIMGVLSASSGPGSNQSTPRQQQSARGKPPSRPQSAPSNRAAAGKAFASVME